MGIANMPLTSAGRERALQLIRQVRDPALPDEELAVQLDELERLVVNPHIGELLFFEEPELSNEEVLERALGYKPFTL